MMDMFRFKTAGSCASLAIAITMALRKKKCSRNGLQNVSKCSKQPFCLLPNRMLVKCIAQFNSGAMAIMEMTIMPMPRFFLCFGSIMYHLWEPNYLLGWLIETTPCYIFHIDTSCKAKSSKSPNSVNSVETFSPFSEPQRLEAKVQMLQGLGLRYGFLRKYAIPLNGQNIESSTNQPSDLGYMPRHTRISKPTGQQETNHPKVVPRAIRSLSKACSPRMSPRGLSCHKSHHACWHRGILSPWHFSKTAFKEPFKNGEDGEDGEESGWMLSQVNSR